MKIKLQKNEDGTFDVVIKRTRREEASVPGVQGVPQGDLGPVVETLVKKVRKEPL